MEQEVTGRMTPETWAQHVAGQQIVVAMRFSYWGRSGWQGASSKEKALLFDRDRLLLRITLLQSVALPSLAAQTDQNFHLHVLTAMELPRWAKVALREALEEALSPSQFTVDPRPWGLAASQYRNYLKDRYGASRTLQVVLDDDDGLSIDFLETLRRDMALMAPPESSASVRFVSQARGFGLDLTDLESSAIELYPMRYRFINLGLALSSPAGGINIYGIAHQRTPLLYPHVVRRDQMMWVRTIHNKNDSRAAVRDGWTPVQAWREEPDIAARFPWLLQL
jgi:Putative rhamnosyl transferase